LYFDNTQFQRYTETSQTIVFPAFQAFSHMFNNFSGTIIITDPNAVILYANPSVEERTGFSVAQAVGKRPGELWGGHMLREFYDRMWQTIREEKRPFVGEVKNKRTDGTFRRMGLHIAPIINRRNEAEYYIAIHPAVTTDVEERQFQQEFAEVFAPWHVSTSSETIAWLARWTKGEAKLTLDEGGVLHKTHLVDMVSFFRTELINPIAEKFQERKADAELVRLAQEKPSKFHLLYEKYQASVEQYFLRRLGGDVMLAEECTQETFIRAFRFLPQYHITNASYQTYLMRIAHNLLVSHYRKQAPLSLEEQEGTLVSEDNYEGIFDQEELRQLLETVSDVERDILTMKYIDELSIRDIAVTLGKTENAVKLMLSRTRKKLRNREITK